MSGGGGGSAGVFRSARCWAWLPATVLIRHVTQATAVMAEPALSSLGVGVGGRTWERHSLNR
jgi:hypothetical protein